MRILSLTTVLGLVHVLFNGYNVKPSSLESSSNLKTIFSMYKVLPVSTIVLFFPSYRWHRSTSSKITGNGFVPFNETAFRSQKRARSSVNTAGQG